ncbi:MAG: V-type sodium ATPase subunit B [Chlamydiia bacterium]|nr:V-type sodium ATPase subunit B [Chlamydiia bacterium]
MSRITNRIAEVKKGLVCVKADWASINTLVRIDKQDGTSVLGTVLSFKETRVVIQVFGSTAGIQTGDKCTFLQKELEVSLSDDILGRRLNYDGSPADSGPPLTGEAASTQLFGFNPCARGLANEPLLCNIPAIDMFNTLVVSQKLPIFCESREDHGALIRRISNQAKADLTIVGGMGFTHDEYLDYVDNFRESGTMDRSILVTHLASEDSVRAIAVPDTCLTIATYFARLGKKVLVLLSDMSYFADALKEVQLANDALATTRGYTAALYSDLALRYEMAINFEGEGSITLLAVTTMPGGDVTHPIPDNTGYITEGQLYLNKGVIELFGSLSRLKQLVIGKKTREDHGHLMNMMTRLYADARKTKEKAGMGFNLSSWDEKLLHYSDQFESRLMDLHLNIELNDALDISWEILAECFSWDEVPLKESLKEQYWPKVKVE